MLSHVCSKQMFVFYLNVLAPEENDPLAVFVLQVS